MTYQEIVSVLGPIDDDLAATLVATNATVEELQEAWSWLQNDEALIGQGRPLPGTRLGDLMAMLEQIEPDDEPS